MCVPWRELRKLKSELNRHKRRSQAARRFCKFRMRIRSAIRPTREWIEIARLARAFATETSSRAHVNARQLACLPLRRIRAGGCFPSAGRVESTVVHGSRLDRNTWAKVPRACEYAHLSRPCLLPFAVFAVGRFGQLFPSPPLPSYTSIRSTRCVLTVIILAIDAAGTLAQHERQEQEGPSAPR